MPCQKKAIRNPHISDRKLRSMDVKDLIEVRQELKQEKRIVENIRRINIFIFNRNRLTEKGTYYTCKVQKFRRPRGTA